MMMYCQLLFLLYLDSILEVGDTNQQVQIFTIRPVLYPPSTVAPLDNGRGGKGAKGGGGGGSKGAGARGSERKKDNTDAIHAVKPSPKKSKCGIQMLAGCQCLKSEGSFSIDCTSANLCNIPQIDVGPVLVRTLSLEKNNLTEINTGDFFGLKVEILNLGHNCLKHLEFLAFWGLEFYLETLDLSYNLFQETPADALRLLRHVETLKLAGNRISTLRNNDFSSLHKLQMLFMDNNPISVIEPSAFHSISPFLLSLNRLKLADGLSSIPTVDFGKLHRLRLAHNHIDEIPEGWFRNLTSLQMLNLENNMIGSLHPESFNGAEKTLHSLNLKKNKIRKVPQDALRRLGNLKFLDLSSNRIRKIRTGTFNYSNSLQTLDLSRNGIKDIHKNSLVGLDQIREIDFRHNALLVLYEQTFYWEDLSNRSLYFADNPWLCNCLLKWFKREHKRNSPKSALSKIFQDSAFMFCARPEGFEGRPIVRVPRSQFTCDHNYYFYEYDHY